jgi:hypothetical protein
MGQLVVAQWQDATDLLVAPWQVVSGSLIRFILDSFGRCQLGGEVYYPGGNPPEGSIIMQCPAGSTPTTDVTVTACEDVIPSRFYRVDINTDGNIRLRFPTSSTSGKLFLDTVSWVTT